MPPSFRAGGPVAIGSFSRRPLRRPCRRNLRRRLSRRIAWNRNGSGAGADSCEVGFGDQKAVCRESESHLMTAALRSYDEALLRRAFDIAKCAPVKKRSPLSLPSTLAFAEASLAGAVFIHDVGAPRRVSIFRGCLPSDVSPSVKAPDASSGHPKPVTFLRAY
jgi:hypothetical protein